MMYYLACIQQIKIWCMMSEIRLKKQINELRSSLFDKKGSEDDKELKDEESQFSAFIR